MRRFRRIMSYATCLLTCMEMLSRQLLAQARWNTMTIIRLSSCYRVTGYMCTKRRPYVSTVDHEASLIIGKKARFVPIEGLAILTVYLKFATYGQLKDYIGRVESNFLKPMTKNIVLRKTPLRDEWKNKVEITLWPEMQHLYGDEVKAGDIIIIT